MASTMVKQRIRVFWYSLLLLIVAVAGTAGDFSLEAVMSSAFPSNLVASPRRDVVAWVFNWRGQRNIWIAEGPDYKARQLTEYTQDDGQELGSLAFDSEGKIILYVRGGSANRAGEYPNPTSDPKGAEQAIWAIKVAGGKPWRIGLGTIAQCRPQ